jgi:hypothetical protein
MSFVVVLVFTAVGQWSVPAAAWALSANACVPDSCKRLQLWSNYAALYSEDGRYLVVNASVECFDSTAAAEVDIKATQGNTTADLGSGAVRLACDGTLQTVNFAGQVPEGANPFEANLPVNLKMRLDNGITELRVDNTQTVQPKDGTVGTRNGLEFGIERVAIGYADPRLENRTNFTVTMYYNCPTGYPENGSLRAAQPGGRTAGAARYRLTCDGTNRARQVAVSVYDVNIMNWTVGSIELINQLGGGDVSEAPAMWQRIAELPMAAKAELPAINRQISNLQEDVCATIPEGSAAGSAVTIGKCENAWTAAADGTLIHANGLCLDGSDAGVVVTTCDGSDRQKWTLNPREKNFSISTGGKCLAPADRKIDIGTKLVLSDCVDKGGYQGWWLT